MEAIDSGSERKGSEIVEFFEVFVYDKLRN